MKCLEESITVFNHNGIHSRVASQLAGIAGVYEVSLTIIHGADKVDCSSILDVLSMAFVNGTSLVVRAEGCRPEQALREVRKLLAGGDL